MKDVHWDIKEHFKNFDPGEISTLAILGAALVIILLMTLSLFYTVAPQTELLIFPGP